MKSTIMDLMAHLKLRQKVLENNIILPFVFTTFMEKHIECNMFTHLFYIHSLPINFIFTPLFFFTE